MTSKKRIVNNAALENVDVMTYILHPFAMSDTKIGNHHSSNISITPTTAIECRQCLPLSVVQLKDNHCHNGVVDTFGRN